jgi:hypothetical protein
VVVQHRRCARDDESRLGSGGKPSVAVNDACVKWIGLVAVLAVVALAAYSYRSRHENPYCQTEVKVNQQGPRCHKYKYWWDR